MSRKIEKDQEVNVKERQVLNPASFQAAELVFSRGGASLAWSDIQNAKSVCREWSKYVSGPYTLNKECRKRFYETFPGDDEKIVRFHNIRAEQDNAENMKCLLLLLESQMLLRELAEYQRSDNSLLARYPSPFIPLFVVLTISIRDQLAKLNFGDEDESDLLAKIQQLRNELVTNFVRNDQIEKEQKTLEFLVQLH